jgi:hypothetical protein
MRNVIESVSVQAVQGLWGNIMNTSICKIRLIWTVPVLLLIEFAVVLGLS